MIIFRDSFCSNFITKLSSISSLTCVSFKCNVLVVTLSVVKLKYDRGKTFAIENKMFEILLLMSKRTNKQFELISVDPNSNKFKKNGVDVSLVPDGIKMKRNVYDFSKF